MAARGRGGRLGRSLRVFPTQYSISNTVFDVRSNGMLFGQSIECCAGLCWRGLGQSRTAVACLELVDIFPSDLTLNLGTQSQPPSRILTFFMRKRWD